MPHKLSSRKALYIFIFLVIFLLAQAVWWVVFMARLVGEKERMALELNAAPEYLELMQKQEIRRQIMVGLEGSFFILVFAAGVWLMYRAVVRTEELKYHQQNFLMAVTHELKTPLASMRIYMDTLQSPKIPPEKKAEIIPRLKEDAARLEKLVQNILEAGKFERHGYHLNLEETDLSKLIRERAIVLEKIPAEIPKSVKFEIQDGISIQADASALGRAIDTILENSLQYHDGKQIAVDVRLEKRGSKAVLEISDLGIGVERKEIGKIFDRFYRVGDEMTRKSSGTGLGLYLCREIIQAHGGKVEAQSDGIGRGTKFIVTLKVNGNG
jgi:signal transduction histidine kinase